MSKKIESVELEKRVKSKRNHISSQSVNLLNLPFNAAPCCRLSTRLVTPGGRDGKGPFEV